MANISINEISQNYTYNIRDASFATVALPITACWGPGYIDSNEDCTVTEEELESVVWSHFEATQTGLESFVSTFRGPISSYRLIKDYSYQMAMTLLTAGYDVLVCRLAAGNQASGNFTIGSTNFPIKAKYPGTFGNKLKVVLQKVPNYDRWNIITYIVDDAGIQTAVENKVFVFNPDHSTDTILQYEELESNFIEFTSGFSTIDDSQPYTPTSIILTGGSDHLSRSASTITPQEAIIGQYDTSTPPQLIRKGALQFAQVRYRDSQNSLGAFSGMSEAQIQAALDNIGYLQALNTISTAPSLDITRAENVRFREWCYTSFYQILSTLEDKLAYNPNRIISPGWDDQDLREIKGTTLTEKLDVISPLHTKLMEVAYYSRCATAYLDIPRSLGRSFVYNESSSSGDAGYAQMLARSQANTSNFDVNAVYFPSHSALFAPWGKYTYAGTGKQNVASPSFLALMIDRAMILNQPSQYEWELPVNRKHNLRIGKLDYNISKKYLDVWQSIEGVGINCITMIPDVGVSIWGNSTLYEVPPATYQALANLSTRKLVNAIENLAYKCGILITFQYNNDQAYNSFYTGMTPLLDTMRNIGAIEDYYIRMSEDVNGLDQVNANSVVGTIYLVIDGVINNISIDLIALPPQTDLNEFKR